MNVAAADAMAADTGSSASGGWAVGTAQLYDRRMSATDERPLSSLPSPLARAVAFGAIVLAGLAGALIGWSFVDIQCTGSCTTPGGIGAVVGGLMAACGVAVVAVLTMRAMAEWRHIKADELYNDPSQSTSTSRRNPSA
jgi:hypothetical protein